MSEIVIVVTGQTGPSGVGGSIDLDDLSDVTITAAASGDILRHNGTAWVDTPGTTHFEAAGAVASHEADTTNVHGIADTSALVTSSGLTSTLSSYLATADAPELIRDTIGTALTPGAGITITPNDGADTITVASSITQYTDEMARDALGTALVAGTGIAITPNDEADTITIAATGGGGTNVPAINNNIGAAAPGMIRLSFGNSMVTLTSGVTYYTGPFELDAAATLTGFAFKIDALTGTAKLRIALVSVDPVDLQPLALTYAVAEQTYTTTGEKTPTFSSQSIPAGVYYVAFRTDNSTLAFAGMRMGPASGWRGTEEGYITASHFTVSEAYGAFSSPPTDWTASVRVSTAGTTGLLIPITWVVS